MPVTVRGVVSAAETRIVVQAGGVDLVIQQRRLKRSHDLPCPSGIYGLPKVVYAIGRVVYEQVPPFGSR